MANIREEKKKSRIRKIEAIFKAAKEKNEAVNIEELIAMLIIHDNVSKRTALEEINAVKTYGNY